MRIAVAVILVALVAGLVWWQGGGQPEQAVPAVVVEAPAVTPGALVPEHEGTPAESRAGQAPSIQEPADFDAQVEAMTRRDSDGLKGEILPDGSTRIDLQGRYQQAPVARLNEDGEVEVSEQ